MLNVDLSMLVTVLYVIIAYLFLSRLFFRPFHQILHKRRALIEGRMEESRKRLALVEQRTNEYDKEIQAARSEAYRKQEGERSQALTEKAELVAKAKGEAEHAIREAKQRLGEEADVARKNMSSQVDSMAKELTTVILRDN